MNNQNKVLISLLTASISALAAAPALAGEKSKIIDINEIGSKNKSINVWASLKALSSLK